MRSALFVLALSVAVLQSVSITDCCCGLLCRQPGESCEDCSHPAPAPAPDDAGC